jgi:hypothetical protein
MIRINLTVTDKNKETLEKHSSMTGLSCSELVRRLIDKYLLPAPAEEDQELTAEEDSTNL